MDMPQGLTKSRWEGIWPNPYRPIVHLVLNLMSEAKDEGSISKEKERQLKAFLKRAVEQRKELEAALARVTQQLEEKNLRIQTLEPIVNESTTVQQNLENQIEKQKLEIELLRNNPPTFQCDPNPDLAIRAKQNEEMKNTIQTLTNQVERLNDQLHAREDELRQLKANLAEATSARSEIEQRLITIQKESAMIQSDFTLRYEKLERDFERLQSSSQSSEVGYLELQQKLAAAESEIQRHKTQGGKLKSFLKALQQENSRLKLIESDQETSRSVIDTLQSKLTDKDREIEDLKETINAIQKASSESTEEKTRLEKEGAELKAATRKLQRRLKNKKQKVAELETLVQAERTRTERATEQLGRHSSEVEQFEIALARAESEALANTVELEELRRRDREHMDEVLRIANENRELTAKLRDIELRRNEIVLQVSAPLRYESVIRKSKKEKPEQLRVSLSYLRKVLIEFVSQDVKTQTTLLPILLSCVSCDEFQIQRATKFWAQNHQTKTFILF